MILKTLFAQLARGELSNLAMSEEGEGNSKTIKVSEHPKIIDYVNDGLLQIYSRFILSDKTIIIEQVEHITNYHLDIKYAESSESNTPYHYIKDLLAEPFEGDAIKILSVFDSAGQQRRLNDIAYPDSLFTPQPTTLQVPAPVDGQALGVSYQARHRELKSSGDAYLNQEIVVPFFLENTLKNFVAYKSFSHMASQEAKVSAQEFFNTYETSCVDVEQRDLVNNTVSTTHSKLEAKGFV